MRVFVTGGSGFIGGALIRRLRLESHEVRALVRSSRAEARVIEAGGVPVPGDISRPGPWQKEVRTSDAVVHAAAMVTDWGPRKEFFRINVGGTGNVLDALTKWKGHFIYVSSIAVHGFRPGVYTADSPVSPGRHPYCSSKAAAEALVDSSVERGLMASVVRISGVYGPGDRHFVARLFDLAASGRVFVIGPGDQPSKLIYIDDVVEAILAVLKRSRDPGARYLLNDPEIPNVRALMELALDVMGMTVPVRTVPEWLACAVALSQEGVALLTGSPPSLTRYAVRAMGRRCYFSPEGTSRKLAWSPRMNAREGVKRTVHWYMQSRAAVSPGRKIEKS